MKLIRRACMMAALLLAVSLTACGPAKPQEPDTQMMNFPGLDWGMSPDEVQAALSLKDTEVLEEPGYIGMAGGLDIFGAENAYALFRFFDSNEDGRYSLRYITVWFFPGTDYAAVREALVAQYGAPEAPEYQNSGEWNSETLCRDVMTEEDLAYLETQCESFQETLTNDRDVMSSEEILHLEMLGEYFQEILTKPLTNVVWKMSVYPNYTFPDGREAESQLGFGSDAALYAYEGGIVPQLEALY